MKTAEQIYREIKEITRSTFVHNEQMVAIAHYFETELKEQSEKYHFEQLRKSKPKVCKGCRYWTVIDVLGGEYCRVLEKSVASPRDDFKHKDCPL